MVRLIARIVAAALLGTALPVAAVVAGTAAEHVSDAQARAAILHGDQVAVRGEGTLLDFVLLRMAHQPAVPDTSRRSAMAHRQAVMFAAFLHDSNPAAFARMMKATLDGCPFTDAARTSYGVSVNALWEQFAEALRHEAPQPRASH